MENNFIGESSIERLKTFLPNGKAFPVKEIQSYDFQAANGTFLCKFHLIGDRVLYVITSGELKPEYLNQVFIKLNQYLKKIDSEDSSLVWEIADAKRLQAKVQSLMVNEFSKIASTLKSVSLIPSQSLQKKLSALFGSGSSTHTNIYLSDSLKEAVMKTDSKVISKNDQQSTLRQQLSSLSKNELIEQLVEKSFEKKNRQDIMDKDLLELESGLRDMIDHLDVLACRINSKYIIRDFNKAFIEDIHEKYELMPEIGQNFLSIFSKEEEKKTWQSRIDKAVNGKQGIYIDQILGKNEVMVYEVKTYPIRKSNKVKGVAIFITDITGLQKSELKLIEKNRDLDRINKELDNFVYRVSHDLRAPITSIMGLINLIKLEDDHEKLRNYFDLQEKSVQKLDTFIKDIINLSRNTRLGITVEKIDFDELLGNLFHKYDQKPGAAKIEKKWFYNENKPLYSDRQRLSTILNHLISNGTKFYNSHQAAPFIHVYVSCNEEYATIEVKDNGTGIAPEYLSKIYTMFFRAAKEDPGSGLGLYIVKETVHKLKGEITTRSKLREGTTFTLKIPNLVNRYKSVAKMR